jgi:hypothetical protein
MTKGERSLMAELYQLAGVLLLDESNLTDGQRDRLRQLLLDVLANPERYTAEAVHRLRTQAIQP